MTVRRTLAKSPSVKDYPPARTGEGLDNPIKKDGHMG